MGLMKFGHWDNIQIVLNEDNFYNFCFLFVLFSVFYLFGTLLLLLFLPSHISFCKYSIIHKYSLVNTLKLLTYAHYY